MERFKNPTGYWEYQGSYSVLLTDDASTDRLPSTVSIHGRIVRVAVGRVKQTMGGIQCYSYEVPFYWGYDCMKEIRDGAGNLIWQNRHYQTD